MNLYQHTLSQIDADKYRENFRINITAATAGYNELESSMNIIIKATGSAFMSESPDLSKHTHILIKRSGQIVQFVPFNKQLSEATAGSWNGDSSMGASSVVLLLENEGRLERSVQGFVTATGIVTETVDVYSGIHRNEDINAYWHKYTECQISNTESIIQSLQSAYQVKYILGNEEVCPGSAEDPGPAFPLEMLRRKLTMDGMVNDRGYKGIRLPEDRVHFDSIFSADKKIIKDDARIVSIRKKNGGWYKLTLDLGGFTREEWVNV